MTFKIKEIIIICPKCKNTLIQKENSIFCNKCRKDYFFKQQLDRNIPSLLLQDNVIIEEKKSVVNRAKDFLKNNIPDLIFYHLSLTYSHQTKKNMILIKSLLNNWGKILFVGGGQIRRGNKTKFLGNELIKSSINLEIGSGKNVDIIGDAHQLPFENNCFDCVISQAVLEHTKDSEKCLDEMFRVLKKGGIIYTEVPFLQPVHMDSDFRRFTLMGLEELHVPFQKIESEVSAGPASSLGWHLCTFISTALSFNNQRIYDLIYLLCFPLMIPFKYLDLIFGKYKNARISASGFYFLGRK